MTSLVNRVRPGARMFPAALLLGILAVHGTGMANPLGTSVCAVLKELIPEVKGYQPAGAKAQLVMALIDKHESDAQRRQVWAQIDPLATSTCPKEREVMLGIVKTKTLAEALR